MIGYVIGPSTALPMHLERLGDAPADRRRRALGRRRRRERHGKENPGISFQGRLRWTISGSQSAENLARLLSSTLLGLPVLALLDNRTSRKELEGNVSFRLSKFVFPMNSGIAAAKR